MPTPSTNTPPTPPSLSPSCPEDGEPRSASLRWPQAPEHGQQASEVGTEGHADTHPTSPGPATVATSSRNDTNDTNDTETDAMIEDEPTSAVSSRSTTVSPAPESTATAGTTPAASAPDEPDSVKQMDVDENTQFSVIDGVQIPVKDNTDDSGRVPMASQSSQADSSKDQEAGSSSPVEEDEDYVAPSFGPDFPSMRVRAFAFFFLSFSINSPRKLISFLKLGDPNLTVPIPPSRESVPRHPTIRETSIRCPSGDQACRLERILFVWISTHPRSVPSLTCKKSRGRADSEQD